MKNLMTRLFREEEGQGMVEYAILIAAMAIIVFAAVTFLNGKINDILEQFPEDTNLPAGKPKA